MLVGAEAFTTIKGDGYYGGKFKRKTYSAHRVVFFLTHGYWPACVDHVDGNILNNEPTNLRAATLSENQHNMLVRGYRRTPNGKYEARIKLNGKRHYLGAYETADAAHQAYLSAKRHYHPTAPPRCFL
ncbi:HNH homing endonuclease [Pectobacterium phage PP90]|uniref:HNH homing endonuclease n=1 Tax=Pectobacterium phage PP90 TaxID=1873959 RepID=A0A1B1PEJ2_9CAUD|nr:HNH homing endonuclease [Pectobacterium phage PP90]